MSVLAVAVLLLAACSDDDSGTVSSSGESGSETGSGTGSGTAEKPDQAEVDRLTQAAGLEGDVNVEGEAVGSPKDGKLETELDDYYFGPTFIEADPGSTVTLTLHNEGSVDHTFTVDSADIDETVSPGDEAEVEVQVPNSGSLAYYCRFHRARGMQGAVVVTG
jgi:plastocyanin